MQLTNVGIMFCTSTGDLSCQTFNSA